MTAIKYALCAAILALAFAAPADAGYRRAKVHKPQHLVVWVPLFLGVGY